MHCVPAPLALRGFGSGFDSSRAQNPDPQRLRRRFFHAQNQVSLLWACTRHMHCVPAPLALRGFGPGFDSSRAQNPDPQRLRRRSFHAQKKEHKHPQMCFLLLFSSRTCMLRKSVVKFYSLPAQCAENRKHSWRIRLAAYGARLERVLG